MTMDVSLRLRLQNQLSKEAKVAERDLRDLANTAKRLGTTRSNHLGRDLNEIRSAASKSEGAIGKLGSKARQLNQINTDAAEREIRNLGSAATQTGEKITAARSKLQRFGKLETGNLDKVAGNLERIDRPAASVNTSMGLLSGTASSAIGALAAFASVDGIVRGLERMSEKFRELNRDVASVAVTAEMRNPETVAKMEKSNETLSIRYGIGQKDVNSARKTYAAAGVGIDQQESILDPTLKAAKAGDSTGETISQAVIALQQNLKVKDTEVPAALDMMSKGAKLGSFEVDAMAKNFPKLGSLYATTGRSGLDATAELVALAQIVRMGAGTQDQASTNLENILSKLTSPDTVDNFADKDVDIEKIKQRSLKNGTPYMLDLVDEVMKITGGDEFRIGELFGDMQAKQALLPLINNREKFTEFLKEIRTNASGTVDADYNFLRELPKERADRRSAAQEATAKQVGGVYEGVISPVKDFFLRIMNTEYRREEGKVEEKQRLGNVDIEDLTSRISDKQRQLGNLPRPRFGDVDALGSARSTLELEIQQLRIELDAARSVQQREGDLGKTTWQIPVPESRPGPVPEFRPPKPKDVDLSGAAERAMQTYNEKLDSEGDRAIGIASEKAAEMQRVLNFTAQPTIAPTFVPPSSGGSTAPASEKHSSLQNSSSLNLTQNISTPNPKLAALKARRDQARAIQQAKARSLHDVGRGLA